MATYIDLLYQVLAAEPDAVAFVWKDGSLTYRQTAERVSQVAHALRAAGLGQGDGVAMLSTNHPESFVVMMGAIAAGCRYTSLHPMGSADDHTAVLARAEVSAFCYEGRFDEHVSTLRGLPEVIWRLDEPAYLDQPTTRPRIEVLADDLAFLPFTGGTTGVPKGVMLPHRVLVANALMTLAAWELPETPRFLAVTPVSHATGLILLPVLARGGTVVLQQKFELEEFARNIAEHRPNMTFVVPSILYALLDAGTDLSGFETIVYGASPMAPARLAEAIERFGPIFMQMYAQTEAPNTVTVLRRGDHTPGRLESCGRPVPGNSVKLLDPDGDEVPIGEIGEICVRGPLVMDGYWKAPDLTAEAMRGGWLHTGDLARADERGLLTIVDRAKDMVVTGGFNVYSREVEDVLVQHPAVGQAAVIGVPDPKWGEAVLAVVITNAPVTADELIAFVKEHKGSVHAPKRVEFVDSLPLTAVGKPDKKQLRARYWADTDRQVG
ncbi:AMP-binding protein [Nocardia pseudobrasiliensis]|uniref:Fatty-acyl-CoA synthase n=1 Tax=Nocardia pseudobrasiliensis TaxID=45979 RepID=A0A370IBS3_9NOCA|nr:AMP-binding protein [Nocardia pseudobrasiliensis]RDI68185.1 fatty-acyl-CoA synthase [Nocardia pseudobrasiliensis]